MSAEETPPVLPPIEAVEHFRQKGLAIGFDWRDIWAEEHARAFTVAKAMSRDLLQDIRAAVDKAISEGQSLDTFRKQLRPVLEAKGWWGRKEVTDPATGEVRKVQLGSPRRLKTIYQTNMRTSYQAGRWQRIERQKERFPYIRYVSVMDGRERPEHGAWHDTILPVDDPWWDTHYPPCDWGCRCTVIALNDRMMKRRGYEVTGTPTRFPKRKYVNGRTGEIMEIERGIGAGWDYNVGKAPGHGLVPAPIGTAGETVERSVSGRSFAPLRPFFDRLGLNRKQAGRDPAWFDVAGWPVAIAPEMFDGKGYSADELRRLGSILAEPDEIRWLWVRDKKDGFMLMRRYLTSSGLIDIGSAGWRAKLGKPAAAARKGVVAFSAARLGGDYARTDRIVAAAEDMWASPEKRELVIGPVSDALARRVKAFADIDVAGYRHAIATSGVRHVRKSHGYSTPATPNRTATRAVTPADLARLPDIIERGLVILHGEPNRKKPRRIDFIRTIGNERYVYRALLAHKNRQLLLHGMRIELLDE